MQAVIASSVGLSIGGRVRRTNRASGSHQSSEEQLQSMTQDSAPTGNESGVAGAGGGGGGGMSKRALAIHQNVVSAMNPNAMSKPVFARAIACAD